MSSKLSTSEPGSAPHTRRITRRQLLTLGASAAAVGVPYTIHSNKLDTVHTVAPSAPGGAGAVRIAQLTDYHAPHSWVRADHLVEEVRRFDPHLVVVTGDAVDQRGNEHLVRFYDRLEPRVAKYACLGNWEYQGNCDLGILKREYARAGVRLLVNERDPIEIEGRPIDVVAIDDWRHGTPRFELLAGGPSRDGELSVLLAHCPIAFDLIAMYESRRITMLAGHTHGGQIAPFGIALITPEGSGRYVSGWYRGQNDAHSLYVSRGIGHTLVPLRLGARPELTLLTI